MSTENPAVTAPALGDSPEPATQGEPSVGFHELNSSERATFLKEGKLPTREKPAGSDGKTADSSTAPAEGQKAAETAATDKPAASEPAAPAKDKKDKPKDASELRFDELLTHRRRAEDRAERAEKLLSQTMARLEALEAAKSQPDGKGAESSSATDPSAKKKGMPKLKDFEGEDGLERWEAAMEDYRRQTIMDALSERESQYQSVAAQHAEYQRAEEQAVSRLMADEKAHPELEGKVHPDFIALRPTRLMGEKDGPPGPHNYAKDYITFECEHPKQLCAFYSDPANRAAWDALMQMDARGIERAIARQDVLFDLPSSPAATGPKPVPKTHTKAPEPTIQTGPKNAGVHDVADTAVNGGDFKGFMREMDEREGVSGRRYGIRRG